MEYAPVQAFDTKVPLLTSTLQSRRPGARKDRRALEIVKLLVGQAGSRFLRLSPNALVDSDKVPGFAVNSEAVCERVAHKLVENMRFLFLLSLAFAILPRVEGDQKRFEEITCTEVNPSALAVVFLRLGRLEERNRNSTDQVANGCCTHEVAAVSETPARHGEMHEGANVSELHGEVDLHEPVNRGIGLELWDLGDGHMGTDVLVGT